MEKTKPLMYKSVYTALVELGLKKTEIDCYMASLSLGPSTISALAKHLKLSRPNVYKLVRQLEQHGLAQFSKKERFARTFIVESPTVILELVRKKQKTISNLDFDLVTQMPSLLAEYHQGSARTKIKIIEGEEQFLKLFFQILKETKDESQFLGSAKDFIGFISWNKEREWIKERMRKGIKIKALLLPSEDAYGLKTKDKSELRETRILLNCPEFVTGFQLFANKVIFWQPKAPIAFVVEDEYIVQMMRGIFDLCWRGASDAESSV